ncbi:unnamed protein product [Allacma fusca]|uniref:Transposase n=1 Tax=Allacma fusca TaxID=39272 RepID=A0A8J2PSH7_9HEXA|nr:unnamed protein product [Allacma fusca]
MDVLLRLKSTWPASPVTLLGCLTCQVPVQGDSQFTRGCCSPFRQQSTISSETWTQTLNYKIWTIQVFYLGVEPLSPQNHNWFRRRERRKRKTLNRLSLPRIFLPIRKTIPRFPKRMMKMSGANNLDSIPTAGIINFFCAVFLTKLNRSSLHIPRPVGGGAKSHGEGPTTSKGPNVGQKSKSGNSNQLILPSALYARRIFKIDQYGLPVLNDKDCSRRLEFASKILRKLDQDKKLLQSVIFSDEGNFRVFKLPGSQAQKQQGRRNESSSLPVIVWCGMTSKDIIGPYFFNSFVNENSYLRMLKSFMLPRIEELGYSRESTWFQQDGAPPHRSKNVLKYLRRKFGDRLISYGCATFWPARSQDLTPLDYFLWDHLKGKITTNYRPTNAEDLKECITLELENLHPDLLETVVYDFRDRIKKCIEAKGKRFDARKDFS